MKKVLLIMLLLFSGNSLFAQSEDTTYKYWMTIGAMLTYEVVSLNLGYTFSLGSNFYKASYLKKGGFSLSGNSTVGNDGYLFNTIDISFGKRLQSEWFQAAFFVGPSYLFGKKELSEDNYENYNTVGLQSDWQLLFRIADEVGIGVGLYGNLNFEKNYAGLNVNLTLGNGK